MNIELIIADMDGEISFPFIIESDCIGNIGRMKFSTKTTLN